MRMLEKAHVTFYRIQRCGYYKHGAPEPDFGSVGDLLAQLNQWSVGKQLANTKLIEPSGDGDDLPVYLFGIDQRRGHSLITMWNEVPATKDGKIASAPANAKVGSAQQVLNRVQLGTIPGFPTYFWFSPNTDVFATLRFENLVTAQKSFQSYCEQFLATTGVCAVQLPPNDDSDLTIYGYRANTNDKVRTNVYPLFRTSLFTKKGEHELIISRAAEITRVHRRADLSLKNTSERTYWQQGLDLVGLGTPRIQPKAAKIRASVSAQLTTVEVKNIVKDWATQGDSQWDDYGFQFRGDSAVHWLSQSNARGSYQIEVVRGENGQIDSANLLDKIVQISGQLNKLIE